MAADRKYNVHFLVAKEDDVYAALCYEFTTAGQGPDVISALRDAIDATFEYLEYMTDTGKSGEAARPAPPELVLDYLDLPSEEGVTEKQLKDALGRVVVASGVLERKVQVEYDQATGVLSYLLPPAPLPELTDSFFSFPVELVLAGA
jgi:hypothetical protein